MANVSEQITADRPCPLTGTFTAEVVATRSRDGGALRNVMSLASGLIYVDPLPIEDLAQFYRDDYRVSYKQAIVPKRKHILRAGRVALERRNRAGGVIRSGMRCLDIGAGGGEWVYLMHKMGCESFGVEPNTGYGTFAKDNYGVDVFLGMYQDSSFARESFDILSLFQVLEHLADPVEDLRRMSGYLKPGGRFIIEVPDILFPGMHFDHKWHEGHLFGFDALTLEAVAASAGLKKVKLEVIPGNLYGVFEKSTDGPVPLPDLSGHFEAAKAALQSGRSSYWTMPGTYTRLPGRLINRISEKWVSERADSPRAVLDLAYKVL